MAFSHINPHLIQIDLSSRHTELCDVRFKHDYFKDGNWANVEVVPSAETQVALKQMHLIFRQDKKGFVLGYRQGPEESAIDRLSAPLQLTFFLKTNDPYFLNYSDIPFEISNSIYYFSNRAEKKIDTDKRTLSLYENVCGEDRVAIGSPVLRFEYTDPITDANIRIEDELGITVYEQDQEGEWAFANINLNGERPGKYYLYIDHIPELEFYLLPPNVGKIFGVLDLYIDKSDTSIYSFFDMQGNTIRQDYTLHFKNRAVRWKYLLIENTPNPIHTDPQISDVRRSVRNESLVQFESPVEVVLDSGAKATMIATKLPIPLREVHDEKFKLRTKKGKAKVENMIDLPCASARSNFKTNLENKSEVFSELLVYL